MSYSFFPASSPTFFRSSLIWGLTFYLQAQFGIVVLLHSQARLQFSLPHWAYYGLFPPLAAASVRPSVSFADSIPQFSMVVPLRSQARLWYSLLHWAYFALLRAQRARFVRPLDSKGSLLARRSRDGGIDKSAAHCLGGNGRRERAAMAALRFVIRPRAPRSQPRALQPRQRALQRRYPSR